MSQGSWLCLSLCCYGLLLTLASRCRSHAWVFLSLHEYVVCVYTAPVSEHQGAHVYLACTQVCLWADCSVHTLPHLGDPQIPTHLQTWGHMSLCKNPSARVSTLVARWRQAWASLPHPTRNDIRLTVEISHDGSIYTTRMHACPSLSHVRLCDPMDCSPLGSSVHGISQARILEWVAIALFKFAGREPPNCFWELLDAQHLDYCTWYIAKTQE